MCNSLFAQDWANLKKYQSDNERLFAAPNNDRVVFMGNSITEGWNEFSPNFFKEEKYINRGISGQTTPQMLLRFRQDVINLNCKAVVILAGTNDIAGNTGTATLEEILGNIISMCELATQNKIEVVLCSVLPAFDYPWSPGLKPNEKIPALNKMIKEYAEKNNFLYVDYFSKMSNAQNGLRAELTYDGVHPNSEGYKVMEKIVGKVVSEL